MQFSAITIYDTEGNSYHFQNATGTLVASDTRQHRKAFQIEGTTHGDPVQGKTPCRDEQSNATFLRDVAKIFANGGTFNGTVASRLREIADTVEGLSGMVLRSKKEKPPLGIQPRHLWNEERLRVIDEAIVRYVAEHRSIPPEWLSERDLLMKKIPSIGRCERTKPSVEVFKRDVNELLDGQPIWVRDSEMSEWVPRHFARAAQGGVYCYQYGRSKHGAGKRDSFTHWGLFTTTDPALDQGTK